MAAWGTGSFENKEAKEWVWELTKAEDTSFLEEAFARVFDSEDYLDSQDAATAVAAAEVVAALMGRPAADLPEEAVQYVKRISAPPSSQLTAGALHAVVRVQTDKSELSQYWAASQGDGEWKQQMRALQSRLL